MKQAEHRRVLVVGSLAAAAVAFSAPVWTGSAAIALANGRATPPAIVRQLLARTKSCVQISSGRYAADERGPRKIPVCGVRGAIFWVGDLDVDCDGVATVHCNKHEDPTFLQGTALEPGGRPLNAETTPYVVLPQPGAIFDYRPHVKPGAVVAIIYKERIAYAVFGDTGPREIIGEASYAAAKALGINPDPARGGVSAGVTYIAFEGTKVEDPRSPASIARAGQAAAARFLAKST